METYQQHKQAILQRFETAITLTKTLKQTVVEKNLEEAYKNLRNEKLYVVVCGEFKQGKSNLLNAFLNEPGLFPVDIDITTNLVSTITYGPEEKITVVQGYGEQETTKQIQRHEIPDYVTEQGNADNSKNARLLVIESPNPQLKEGLVWVDTPGIGSLYSKHNEITYGFIPSADVILFTSDASKPLTENELNFLTNKILPFCRNIIFVITKSDQIAKDELKVIIKNNREKLRQVLKCSEEQIRIIEVSSKAKLSYLKNKNLKNLELSNFQNLENQIWQLINQQSGKLFLLRALEQLKLAVSEMGFPLQIYWEKYHEDTKEKLENLEKEIGAIQDKLTLQLDDKAAWRNQLNTELQNLRQQIVAQFEEEYQQIQNQAEKYLNENPDNVQRILTQLQDKIYNLMSKLYLEIRHQTMEVNVRIESSLELNLDAFKVEGVNWDGLLLGDNNQSQQNDEIWEKAASIVQKGMFSIPTGAALGGFLGQVVGGTIGTLLGGPITTGIGATLGQWIGVTLVGIATTKEAFDRGVSQRQEQNKQKVQSFLEECHSTCQQQLEDLLFSLEKSIEEDLKSQIRQRKETYQRTLTSLQESRKLVQAEDILRSKDLREPLKVLKQLQIDIEQLTQVIVKVGK